MSVLPPNQIDIVLIAVGLALLLIVSILWVVWSRGLIHGKRIGRVNKNKPPRLIGRLTLGSWIAAVILTHSWSSGFRKNDEVRFIAIAISIVSVELLLTWIFFWLVTWKSRFGMKNPKVGEIGLDEGDFQPLINQLNGVKLRTDLMLFGSVTLGAVWWAHFANFLQANERLMRVITLCGELSLGMLSLGIIALISIGIDVYVLKFTGMAREAHDQPLAKFAHLVSVVMSKFGTLILITSVIAWALKVYFTEPLAPLDVFVLSIPLGVIWESAGNKRRDS